MRALALVGVSAALGASASAQVIGFEGAAPGAVINVSPTAPYTEAGFRLTPLNGSSAVFGPGGVSQMPGNSTAFFGFQEANLITMTSVAGGAFDLASVLVGSSTIATGPTTVTITGYRSTGAPLVSTSPNLTTAVPVALNWTGLTRVEFLGTDDSAIDNIAVGSSVCYPNCDGSTAAPILNVNDFVCFLNRFAAADSYANCDVSTVPPVLNVNDFACFINRYAAGCP